MTRPESNLLLSPCKIYVFPSYILIMFFFFFWKETTMANSWYEILSVLQMMTMLSLSQANLLLLPKTSTDGYQSKVSVGQVNC